ncbi:MAG TPA: outer membrane protein [Pseudolabrys sp.]|nr:outer membrane protein [Pseudolabrys sp.]
MKFKSIATIVASGIFAAASFSALAADLPRPSYKAPVYSAPPAFSWTGFYLGINGGYGFGTANWVTPPPSSFDTSGYLVGATLGYNLQTGSIVWGLEADYDFSTVKGDDANAICAGPSGGCNTKMKSFATGRGRIGYAFGNYLPYITAGAAYANFENLDFASESKSKFGWTAGLGLEYAFMAVWSAKFEYLYADFGTMTCETCSFPAQDIQNKVSVVRVGLNYRF